MTPQQQVQDLLNFIDDSPSPWHVVQTIEKRLPAHWQRLNETAAWSLQAGGCYYVVRDDSSIILFVIGHKPLLDTGFKLLGAHTDSPGLRVKPNAGSANDGFLRLSMEVYGGPLLATFADRDLSLAGRLSYRAEKGELARCLVKFDHALLRLPNLAIHLNRGVNDDGLKLQKQNELTLILSRLAAEQLPKDTFTDLLQQQAGIAATRLLSWELAAYDTQKGSFWGMNQEFYANSQLDNLASCHAALQALLDSAGGDNTLVCALFDHEEIGSDSNKGANSSFLPDVLERIALTHYDDRESYARILAKSFLISADMAHAYQPSFPNVYDAEHKVFVNQGPVIKTNVNCRYSSESTSAAHFMDWCERAGVPYQQYSHRNDLPCGSTIGPIASTKLGVRAVDVGNPMWAMHSLRESAGVFDHDYMIRALRCFFAD